MIAIVHSIYSQSVHAPARDAGLMDNDAERYCKSYLVKVDKFIDIEKRDERSMNNFINELKSLNIYDQLDKELTGDPNENYQLLSSRLNAAREKHMPRKRVKYKKKLHKKSKWITNGILRSINKKDKLYKTLIQTDLDNTVLYDRLKT